MAKEQETVTMFGGALELEPGATVIIYEHDNGPKIGSEETKEYVPCSSIVGTLSIHKKKPKINCSECGILANINFRGTKRYIDLMTTGDWDLERVITVIKTEQGIPKQF